MSNEEPNDHRLIERVLDGQRELQISVSEVHLLVAQYHAEAQRQADTLGLMIKHLAERCAGIEADAESDLKTIVQKVEATERRVDSTEKKLLVICTVCSVVWTIGGLAWKVLGE